MLCHAPASKCLVEFADEKFGCMESCTGLHADVAHSPLNLDKLDPQLKVMIEKYLMHKHNYGREGKPLGLLLRPMIY